MAGTMAITDDHRCLFFNRTLCLLNGGHFGSHHPGCGSTHEECRHHIADPQDKTTMCYALWHNKTDTNDSRGYKITDEFRGCWLGAPSTCHKQDKCVEHRLKPPKDLFFCCCQTSMCNSQVYHIPLPAPSTTPAPSPTAAPPPSICFLLLVTLVPLISLAILIVAGYSLRKYRKMSSFNELPTNDPSANGYWSSLMSPSSALNNLKPIKLIEVKAQGRFGSVYKAMDNRDWPVAVKIFPAQERYSWQLEQEVFRLPLMKHDNVLAFYGAEQRCQDGATEYWLVTEYHQYGSLFDYLKGNIVTWPQLLKMSQDIARGLSHVHEERSGPGGAFKPAIAHRDFKSKNVLIKSDLTACIADFGLALIFYPDRPTCADAQGQVGTRRYMAPEVLEGAINFSRDAFTRIDMYACGLVLWELLTRCSAQDGPVGDYRLPFEDEIGQHPTLEDMQELVVQQKRRPELKETWRQHHGLTVICNTIEDCWDHDAEARVSASCVFERIKDLKPSVVFG